MKFVSIFAHRLYSVAYLKDGVYQRNEYERLLDQWTDVEYLREFAKTHNIQNANQFVRNRILDAERIEDLLDVIEHSDKPLSHYFRPLNNQEYATTELSKQKGKTSSKDGLRLYAIKIDDDLFAITGGAIKMSQLMDEHPETKKELPKLDQVKAYLKEHDIFDSDSFFEFKTEQDDE